MAKEGSRDGKDPTERGVLIFAFELSAQEAIPWSRRSESIISGLSARDGPCVMSIHVCMESCPQF